MCWNVTLISERFGSNDAIIWVIFGVMSTPREKLKLWSHGFTSWGGPISQIFLISCTYTLHIPNPSYVCGAYSMMMNAMSIINDSTTPWYHFPTTIEQPHCDLSSWETIGVPCTHPIVANQIIDLDHRTVILTFTSSRPPSTTAWHSLSSCRMNSPCM